MELVVAVIGNTLYICAMNSIEQTQVFSAFVRLGRFLFAYSNGEEQACTTLAFEQSYQWFEQQEEQAVRANEWFTRASIRYSIRAIASGMLVEDELRGWLAAYPDAFRKPPVRVGVIAAGNIPLVCFHDFLCVLMSGNSVVLKPSSKDSVLIRSIVKLLLTFEPNMAERITLMEGIDQPSIGRLIATGSNNTARYIEYAYRSTPSIVRKNRTSVAILSGTETEEELTKLCDDIFLYAGMGCRNVAKLYVPTGYSFDWLLAAAKKWEQALAGHLLYKQCYLYERANALLSDEVIVDGGFFILKQTPDLSSPLAVVSFQYYEQPEDAKAQLLMLAGQLQCVVGAGGKGLVPFGGMQNPSLFDYADGIDTMRWLTGDLT